MHSPLCSHTLSYPHLAVATGFYSCAHMSDLTMRCWGNNNYVQTVDGITTTEATGQLGDGTTTDRYTPVVVSGLSGVIQIALGGAFPPHRRCCPSCPTAPLIVCACEATCVRMHSPLCSFTLTLPPRQVFTRARS